LYLAASRGYLEVVRLLLRHGADVHTQPKNGVTPLQLAMSSGHAETAQLLLEYGAVLDKQTWELFCQKRSSPSEMVRDEEY